MSEHRLPDDLTRWPKDPYRLLGVSFGVSPRDVKRAYLHLVRQFKPEHFPDQFQLIRQAYEVVLRNAENSVWPLPAPGTLEIDAAAAGYTFQEFTDLSSRVPPRNGRSSGSVPSVGLGATTLDALWERACDGGGEEAYRALVALHAQKPNDEEVVLRLHWLLVALPELDPQRTASDWLVSGLQAKGTQSSLWLLYRRTLAADPAEALSERGTRLLRAWMSTRSVLDLSECRWRAAKTLQQWDVITTDLALLRTTELRTDEPTWAQLLLNAATQLAWGGKARREAARRLGREVESLQSLDIGLEERLARLDFQFEVAAGLAILAKRRDLGIARALVPLIPRSWEDGVGGSRPLILSFVDNVAADPRRALRALDRVRAKGPAVLGHLAALLDDLECESARLLDRRSDADIIRVAVPFLRGERWWNYREFRPRLLRYCIREALALEALAKALMPLPEFKLAADRHLAHELDTDWPLRLVLRSCELSCA
jgi:hypothetical protein